MLHFVIGTLIINNRYFSSELSLMIHTMADKFLNVNEKNILLDHYTQFSKNKIKV